MSLVLAAARKSFATRVSTLTSPPTRAPCDPSEVTTCVPSDAYVLGVTRLPFGACSASTSLIFRCPDQIAKLAAHAWKGKFWVELANAASLRDPRVPEPLLQSWSTRMEGHILDCCLVILKKPRIVHEARAGLLRAVPCDLGKAPCRRGSHKDAALAG